MMGYADKSAVSPVQCKNKGVLVSVASVDSTITHTIIYTSVLHYNQKYIHWLCLLELVEDIVVHTHND